MGTFTTENDETDFLSQQSDGTSETTKRHLLIKVPDYEFNGTREDRTSIGAVWGPGTSKKNSLLALGDADAYTRVDQKHADSGNDLLEGQLIFEDDTRYRGTKADPGGSGWAAMATPPSEKGRRSPDIYSGPGASTSSKGTGRNLQATANIPNYVGWRDHTDGHRITTTRGDKIEIIGGNYRIVSLGRGTGVATYQMSGGIIGDSMEPPGNVSSVTWRECPTEEPISAGSGTKKSGWKWVEQTYKGHVVERFHGTTREESYGDIKIEVTGSPSPSDPTNILRPSPNTDGESEVFLGETQAYGASKKRVGNVDTYAYPTRWDINCGGPASLLSPAIYESTWAASITSYEKVSGSVVEDEEVMGSVTTTSTIHGTVENTERYNAKVTHEYYCESAGFSETWHMLGAVGFREFFMGAFTQLFLGASTTVGLANRFEVFVGAEQQFNIGLMGELLLGKSYSLRLGPAWECFTSDATGGLMKKEAVVSDTKALVRRNAVCLSEDEAHLLRTQLSLNRKMPSLSTQL